MAFESDGGYIAEEFNLNDVPGVSVDSSSLYLGICHGTFLNQVRNNPLEHGYQPRTDAGRGQFQVSEPAKLFD